MKRTNDTHPYSNYDEIKADFLKEALNNSMTTTKKPFSYLWRPNNYRRQIKVKQKTNSTIKKIKSAIGSTIQEQDFNFNNHTKLISIKNYQGCTIQYGKEKLTAIYTQFMIDGIKQTMNIEGDSIKAIDNRLEHHKELIKQTIDNALKSFITQFKLCLSHSEPKWTRYEDWLKGDEFLDSIPEGTIIHDTVGKKVYKKGWEFIQSPKKESPIVHMKNYIKSRALERFSPEIADSINTLSNIINPLGYLKQKIKKIDDLFIHQDIIKNLTRLEKTDLELWLYTLGEG